MNLKAIVFSAVALCGAVVARGQTPVYLDDSKPIEERIDDAISRMSLKEKIALLHAQSKFSAPGVPSLGIPELWTDDGPMGVRPEVLWDQWDQAGWTNDSCTAFPSLTCLAATWNPELAALYGKSIGEEARYRNKSVLLGPGVNIYRTPLNGRNFEYMGEDPYLASKMAADYVRGVQSNGVAVCVKHFAANNHESNRYTTNSIVSDRALYEIYLPAFKAACVDAGAWSLMGGYNLVNGQHATYNQRLVNEILKGEWEWDGVVISDWGAVHDTKQAVEGGLDMEFGTGTDGLTGPGNSYDKYWLANNYYEGVRDGIYSEEQLNDKVRRVLRLTMRTAMDRNRPWGSINSPEHHAACRKIGEEGVVLLKNEDNILPIATDNVKRIAVIGENGIKRMTVGGGSSSLKAQYEIHPLEGLQKRFGDEMEIVYERGYVGDTVTHYNNVWTKQDLRDPRSPEQLKADAIKVAKGADLVLFIGGLNKMYFQDSEGTDRESLDLPYHQNELIEAIADVNPNIVVVNISGTGVAMPWLDKVKAVVQGWYLGNETGNTLAAILAGDVNPSGKLPYTYYASLDQCGAHKLGEYPGTPRHDPVEGDIIDMHYNDDIYVGYRFTDKNKLKPTFPFGHGLSYTTFEYGKATVDRKKGSADDVFTVTVPVTNTGNREGSEIVQLYISDLKSSLPRPVKELKGFSKVRLAPGQTENVSFEISRDALSYFDDGAHKWIVEPGKFEALIGASAGDIRSKVSFEVQ
ncbi:MAG: glycoside hydrolase family 3 C-terminal domain-containing protein [Muribaculaceae bacterium]|nr:glycoside hydrolase family 3 C-terminal domain-containing protein [Muribaculaceae bacterium]